MVGALVLIPALATFLLPVRCDAASAQEGATPPVQARTSPSRSQPEAQRSVTSLLQSENPQ
ncbi:hypothetical protein D9M70_589670 [compost metagenome]